MKRRTFFQTGLAAGVVSAGGRTIAASPLSAGTASRSEKPIRLSANENPLGISPAGRRAIVDGIPDANRYPGGSRTPLLEALAAKHQVAVENIVLGAGSSEVLQMAVQAFGRERARFVIADPTFEDVPSYAEPWGLELIKVPLRADHAHDLTQMRAAAESASGPVVVYICNPNNPTGTLTPCVELDGWIRAAPERVSFIVDEAYFEYAQSATEYWSCMKWIGDKKNVVVARTFSKIYGMAGMRLGYGIGHGETIAKLANMQSHNNVNHLALVAGTASLPDSDHVSRSLQSNDAARRVLLRVLNRLDISYLPSYTNFVMHRINGDIETYNTRMGEHNIAVGRAFPPLLNYSRVSLGTPEEMETFAQVLSTFRERGWV
jgi:histidinol-phosphate aminotransferase